MSCFKEPQKAVTAIHNILDGTSLACALLADLSKAFERVNSHWILELLRIRQAPRWLVVYTKFILFNRRVTHKVQGRFLPSRVILQGVDMGRSFSVYLFCLAMDPLFVYLNRIPGVISVQGYVDDTTIIGNAQHPDWFTAAADCYSDLASAGFHNGSAYVLSGMHHYSQQISSPMLFKSILSCSLAVPGGCSKRFATPLQTGIQHRQVLLPAGKTKEAFF